MFRLRALNNLITFHKIKHLKKISGFKRKPERAESPSNNKPRPSEGSESGKKQPFNLHDRFRIILVIDFLKELRLMQCSGS